MTYRVLLTSTGGGMSPLAIRCLQESRRHEVSVIAVDARADAMGRYFADAFEAVPPGDDAGYVPALADVAARHGADLVLPCSDEEALALSAARETVEATGATLACVDHDTLRRMAHKPSAMKLLADHGIDAPAWRLADTEEALTAAVDEMIAAKGEFAVKPVASRGGRDVYVVAADAVGSVPYNDGRETYCDLASFRRDHMAALAPLMPVLVMERLQPPAWDIDVLAWQGEALRLAPRRRVNPGGVPFKGGIVECLEPLMDLGRRVTEVLNLSWLYDYDVMSTMDGRPVVMELNPRPSGSIAAAVAAGVPLLDDLISLAKGEALPPVEAPVPTAVLPHMALVAVDAADWASR